VVRAVTLEMTTAEAETLVTAQTEGKLQLTLRNPLNSEKKIVTAAPVAPAPMVVAAAPVQKRVVPRGDGGGALTIIRGIQTSVVKVR
jgi:pilus assembly protein CpaB